MPTLLRASGAPFAAVAMAFLAVAISLVFTPARAEGALTTDQLKALSASAATRVVRRDLLSILQPIPRIESGMFRTLHGVSMFTRPYGTKFPGICRRDMVSLKYAPIDTTAKAEEMPLQPYGIEASPLFHVAHLPKTVPEESWPPVVQRPECDRLGDASSWFYAKDEFEAVRGANILKAAVDQVRAGTLKSQACANLLDQKLTCEQAILAEGDLARIDNVESCSTHHGASCYAIDLGSMTLLTIVGHFSYDDVVPDRIESISIEQYLVVT